MVKPILYVDMDGVLVDFPEEQSDIDISIRDECIEWCNKNGKHHSDFEGLFATLLPKKGAVDAVYRLNEKFEVYLLSSAPWENIEAWSDKRRWVEKFLPKLGRKYLILSHRKDLNRGAYLIDDRPRNGASDFGTHKEQEWIHFGSEKFPDWGVVIDYLESEEDNKMAGLKKRNQRRNDNEEGKKSSPESFFEIMFGVAIICLILSIAVSLMVSFEEIDWRDTVTIQLEDDNTFNLVDNGTMMGPFNGTHHDLVPGDKIILGMVPITHLATQSSTSCTSGWDDDYDSMSQDCWTTYWDVFVLDVGGMNFSIGGDKGFMHTCFNAFCNVTATVDGDDYWGLDMYAGRLSITVQEFDWVRWCQGEEICE